MATERMVSTEIGNRALADCFEAVKRLFCFQPSLPRFIAWIARRDWQAIMVQVR